MYNIVGPNGAFKYFYKDNVNEMGLIKAMNFG